MGTESPAAAATSAVIQSTAHAQWMNSYKAASLQSRPMMTAAAPNASGSAAAGQRLVSSGGRHTSTGSSDTSTYLNSMSPDSHFHDVTSYENDVSSSSYGSFMTTLDGGGYLVADALTSGGGEGDMLLGQGTLLPSQKSCASESIAVAVSNAFRMTTAPRMDWQYGGLYGGGGREEYLDGSYPTPAALNQYYGATTPLSGGHQHPPHHQHQQVQINSATGTDLNGGYFRGRGGYESGRPISDHMIGHRAPSSGHVWSKFTQ